MRTVANALALAIVIGVAVCLVAIGVVIGKSGQRAAGTTSGPAGQEPPPPPPSSFPFAGHWVVSRGEDTLDIEDDGTVNLDVKGSNHPITGKIYANGDVDAHFEFTGPTGGAITGKCHGNLHLDEVGHLVGEVKFHGTSDTVLGPVDRNNDAHWDFVRRRD